MEVVSILVMLGDVVDVAGVESEGGFVGVVVEGVLAWVGIEVSVCAGVEALHAGGLQLLQGRYPLFCASHASANQTRLPDFIRSADAQLG